MRTRRVRAAASPEVRAALKAGQISLYRADEISKLSASEQEAVLAQWTARTMMRNRGHAIAARVIRRELTRRSKVDLARIAAAIRAAIVHH
jgi:hypothetical protein